MTTRARRPTFTTNRQRGNAGSPTLNHTTITRAGPSASLGDDPSPHPFWRTTSPHPAHLGPHLHTNRLYTRYYKDTSYLGIKGFEYFEKPDSLGVITAITDKYSKVVSLILGYSISCYLVYPYLTAVQTGSLIGLLSHFCRDLMQLNHTAVSHMTHSC